MIHGAPAFTSDLLPCRPVTAACCPPSPCARALPGSDYYEDSATTRHHQRTVRLPRPTADRAATGRFPRSPSPGRPGRCPALPRQHRHEYAADLPRGLLAGIKRPVSESPSSPTACTAARPASVRFGAGGSLTGRHTLVPRVHLLALLAGPGPSDGADPSRRCRGCSHPCAHLHGRAAPSFNGLLRQAAGGPFHPARCDGASWRTLTCFHTHSSGLSSGE